MEETDSEDAADHYHKPPEIDECIAACLDDEPGQSGMILGDDILLTPQMVKNIANGIPELVFINCCHLGRTSSESHGHGKPLSDFNRFAANIGLQFIRIGVRAVIAAGWAVNDDAGKTFATVFYTALCNQRKTFGEAVNHARRKVWEKHNETNTWAAYQCYGDPGWRLRPSIQQAENHLFDTNPVKTHAHLLNELYNIRQSATALPDRGRPGLLAAQLTHREEETPSDFISSPLIQAEMGLAWAELAELEKAEKWLSLATSDGNEQLPALAFDRLMECRYRIASRQRRKGDLKKVASDLVKISALIPSMDRSIMQASVCRRRALLESENPERARDYLEESSTFCIKARKHEKTMETMQAGYMDQGGWDRENHRFTTFCINNALAIRSLVNQRRKPVDGFDVTDVDRWCRTVQEEARKQDQKEPSFWMAAWQGGIPLLRLMLTYVSVARTTKDEEAARVASREALAAACIEGYTTTMRRGASPRNRYSLAEHVFFFDECVSQFKGQSKALNLLHEHLTTISAAVIDEARMDPKEMKTP